MLLRSTLVFMCSVLFGYVMQKHYLCKKKLTTPRKIKRMLKLKTTLQSLLLLVLSLSMGACRDDLAPREMNQEESEALAPNLELSLEAELGEDESDSTGLRNLTLVGGSDESKRRPQIKLTKGQKIKAHVFFAYANKGSDGRATGSPTLIETPYEMTFEVTANKDAGTANGSNNVLQAINSNLNVSGVSSLRDKAWYIMGVIGAKWNATTKKLEFDPNTALISKSQDVVASGETRSIAIPYTFSWTPITLSTKTTQTGVKDVAFAKGARFKPRGLFMRFTLENSLNYGMYVVKSVLIPEQEDYAARAILNVTKPTADNLKSGADYGFVRLGTGESKYEFQYGPKSVQIVTNPSGGTQTITVQDYKHIIGAKRTNNPYIINPNPKSGYFWLWLADIKSGASNLNLSIIGDPLGRLNPRQNFALTGITIPSGKKGITLGRNLKLSKYRPYTPLEFVARGNVVRPGYGDTPAGFEVGPRYGYPGASITGLWNAGANFGVSEVYNTKYRYPGENYNALMEKDGFKQANRFIPTANDWRTIIPMFPSGNGTTRENQWAAEDYPGTTFVEEGTVGDVMGFPLYTNKVFTSRSEYTQIPLGKRMEISRIRDAGTDPTRYQDLFTQANYAKLGDNSLVGYRWLRYQSSNFADRRKYFCAYRLDFVAGDNGGMRARTVYIGEDTMTPNGRTNAEADEEAWMKTIQTEAFWTKRTETGEVIERIFPQGGWTRPGSTREGSFSRYYTRNRYVNAGLITDTPLVDFEFAKDGWAYHLMYVNTGSVQADNMLLRYFVLDPGIAYEEWGSRN